MAEIPETPEIAELLDRYLQQLQAGGRPDREALLRQHAQLAPLLECVEALHGLSSAAGLGEPTLASSEEDDTADMPRDFASYELLGEIGRGGMGVVFKARQRGLERLVAIKMILSSHLASAEHIRRFLDEARAAAQLRHPNIVHIHEVGQCRGQHYFTMDYIEGKSLAHRVVQGPLEAHGAAAIMEKVARAVDHLHQHGIVHRDLKPLNILLDADEEPYVTDFGLAKFFAADSSSTATGVIAGTPSYMAPEQASGHNADIGPAADVYSLGAILYELLTGRPPHREDNAMDTLLQVLGSEPMPPRKRNPRIPKELEWVCLKCLAASPEARYSSAAALADDLNRFLQGEVLEARSPSWAHRLVGWARREPALASRLATLGVFYVVDEVNHFQGIIDDELNRKMVALIAIWIVGSIILQQFVKSRRWQFPAAFAWGTLDSSVLLTVLLLANGIASPLVVGYYLLIAGSGLWFRVRFVWYMTALSLVSYAILIYDFYHCAHRGIPKGLREHAAGQLCRLCACHARLGRSGCLPRGSRSLAEPLLRAEALIGYSPWFTQYA